MLKTGLGRWALSALVFCASFHVQALEQEAAEALQERLSAYQSLTAQFEQKVVEADGYMPAIQTGTLALQRPNRLRWHVSPPFEQLLVSTGETLYLFDPDFLQVTVRPWSADPSRNPAVLLAGDSDLAAMFNVTQTDDHFLLQPLQPGGTLQQIELTFSGEIPQSITMLDTLGTRTTLLFSQVNMDAEIEPSNFEFSVPPNVDVYYSEE